MLCQGCNSVDTKTSPASWPKPSCCFALKLHIPTILNALICYRVRSHFADLCGTSLLASNCISLVNNGRTCPQFFIVHALAALSIEEPEPPATIFDSYNASSSLHQTPASTPLACIQSAMHATHGMHAWLPLWHACIILSCEQSNQGFPIQAFFVSACPDVCYEVASCKVACTFLN